MSSKALLRGAGAARGTASRPLPFLLCRYPNQSAPFGRLYAPKLPTVAASANYTTTTTDTNANTLVHCTSLYGSPRPVLHTSTVPSFRPQQQQQQQYRLFSSELKGHDILGNIGTTAGKQRTEEKPKILLDGYSTTGIHVSNVIERVDEDETALSGSLHMTGSIIVFPHCCLLWKVHSPKEVTMESLAPIILYHPRLKYFFLGTDIPMDRQELQKLKTALREETGIVLESMTVVSTSTSWW